MASGAFSKSTHVTGLTITCPEIFHLGRNRSEMMMEDFRRGLQLMFLMINFVNSLQKQQGKMLNFYQQ